MLRITTDDNTRVRTLRLEGRLEGPWAALLEKCWRKASGAGRRKAFRVDMSGVSFIDAAGRRVIAAMHKHMTVHELAAMPHYHPTLAEIWTYPAEELAAQIPLATPS